jgi:hypothetical protein
MSSSLMTAAPAGSSESECGCVPILTKFIRDNLGDNWKIMGHLITATGRLITTLNQISGEGDSIMEAFATEWHEQLPVLHHALALGKECGLSKVSREECIAMCREAHSMMTEQLKIRDADRNRRKCKKYRNRTNGGMTPEQVAKQAMQKKIKHIFVLLRSGGLRSSNVLIVRPGTLRQNDQGTCRSN